MKTYFLITWIGISIFFFTLHSNITLAQNPSSGPLTGSSSTFGNFEVGFPGNGSFGANKSIDSFIQGAKNEPILTIVNLAVTFLTAILVIIGVISIVVGGYLYMTAAGNGSQVESSKKMIQAALIGIFIAFISVVILNTINPALGPKAVEPKLPSPSGSPGAIISDTNDQSGVGTGGGGGGVGNGGGGGAGGGGGGGGDNKQVLFGNNIKPSTPNTISAIIDDRNYYIRDANGFDRISSLQEVVSLSKAAPGDADGLGLRIYETLNARVSAGEALKNALIDGGVPDSKVFWVPQSP